MKKYNMHKNFLFFMLSVLLTFCISACSFSPSAQTSDKDSATDAPDNSDSPQSNPEDISLNPIFEYSIEDFSTEGNGHPVKGYLYLPTDAGEKLPVVICSHGFAGGYSEVDKLGPLLAGQGIAVLVFDFYGGSAGSMSGGTMDEMTVFTEQDDLQTVIAAICERTDIDTNAVALFGFSQGGFVSTLAACETPEQFKALYLFAPAYHISDSMRKTFASYEEIEGTGPDYYRIGKSYAQSVYDFDIYENMENYDGSVYLFHGNKDEAVNYRYSKKAASTFPDAEFHMISGASHGITDEVAEIISRHIVATLNQ